MRTVTVYDYADVIEAANKSTWDGIVHRRVVESTEMWWKETTRTAKGEVWSVNYLPSRYGAGMATRMSTMTLEVEKMPVPVMREEAEYYTVLDGAEIEVSFRTEYVTPDLCDMCMLLVESARTRVGAFILSGGLCSDMVTSDDVLVYDSTLEEPYYTRYGDV